MTPTRPMHAGIGFLILVLTSGSPAFAGVLRVGPNGDFDDIQSAVDAASDGDVILVEPGVYEPFVVAGKGVTVQGEPGFTVDDRSGSGLVRLLVVPAGSRAAIKNMDMGSVHAIGVGIEAAFSEGEILLERVSISDPRGHATLMVDHCDRFFASDLNITGSAIRTPFPSRPVALTVRSSRASLQDVQVTGGGTFEAVRIDGDSQVVLSAPAVTGVRGEDSSGCIFNPDGGIGGPGMVVEDSTLFVTGDRRHFIAGGDGGTGSSCGVGGDGGTGVVVLGSSSVIVPARIAVRGGRGGSGGTGSGADGLPSEGPVDRSQQLPLLEMSELRLAMPFTVVLDAVPAGLSALSVFLIASGSGGFVPLGKFGGPPLSALPEQPFVIRVAKTDANGDLTIDANLPASPALLGYLLHVQGAVVDPQGPEYTTNVVVRTVGN